MKDVSFAVIGSGFMGGLLARAASELPYSSCVGAADLDVVRARNLTARYGGRAYEDFEELLDTEHPETVFIATPEPEHVAPVRAAAERGVQVFLEKPIATTLGDADAICQVCGNARVKLMVGHILRFEVSYAMVRSAIVEGSIGRFLSAYARRMCSISEARRLHGRVTPLAYIGVHDIDQILWCHPLPVKSVYAKALKGRVWDELGTFDSVWLMMEFEDGALGTHEVGWCLPEAWSQWQTPASWGGFADVRMNVTGTEGNLLVDFTPMDLYGVDRDGWKLPDTRHWPVLHDKLTGAVKLEVEHFFECVREDQAPLISGQDARRALEVVVAAEQSIAEDRAISLPL